MSEQALLQQPRVIVLDVGNVLVGLDFSRSRQRLQRLFPEDKKLARVQRWLRSVEDPYALGLITTEEFVQGALRELGLGREEFIHLWNDIFIERTYMYPFVQELRAQGYTLGICSNTNELHMQYLQRVNPCFAEARHIIFSYQVGALKPDPAIYQAVEAATGQPAAAHLFLDDLPENVAAARVAGWDAICFETPEQAQAELVARGIQFTPWKL
ncbi:MAG TPA: HAD family phosphatase [Ktedonobacterales bacterium]|nr:HAD family phosphatase [Ktedonobacterales bacterium]